MTKSKFTLTIIAIFFSSTFLIAQTSKEDQFCETVKGVILNLSHRDSIGLSQYLQKGDGVYMLYKDLVKDSYKFFETLGFSDTTFPNYPFYDKVKFTTLNYATLPMFDCSKEEWTKPGTYVDTTQIDHLLSNTAKILMTSEEGKDQPSTLLLFYILENNGRRVVVSNKEGYSLIFYLSYLHGKWWLTIIDKITIDCRRR